MTKHRSERLSQIVEQLSGGRLVRGKELSCAFVVSIRTIYRDIDDLRSTGLKILGEPGIGYMMRGRP